jgi:chaperonin GroES
MNCNIVPKGVKIVIKTEVSPDKTESGLYIPESAKDRPNIAEVIKVGPKCSQVKKGEKILFSKYAGTKFEYDDVEYLLINEADVIAEIKE